MFWFTRKKACNWLLSLVLVLLSPVSLADHQDEFKLGVFAYRPKPIMEEKYGDLMHYIGAHLPGVRFTYEFMELDELEAAVRSNRVDMVFTNPSHYLMIRNESKLSGVVATFLRDRGGDAVSAIGGVIITRGDNQSINSLQDIAKHKIAAPGRRYLGGYQTQAYELLQAGIDVTGSASIVEVGRHDTVLRKVLAGEFEVGFIRTSIIEDFISKKLMAPGDIKVINRQSFGGYPFLVSTRLYPEWPLVALPTADDVVVKRIVAAVFNISPTNPISGNGEIYGFSKPASYLPIERLAKGLKLPPYDVEPKLSLKSLWETNALVITAVTFALALMFLLLLLALASKQRSLVSLYEDLTRTEKRYRQLVENVGSSLVMYRMTPNKHFSYLTEGCERIFGVTVDEAKGQHWDNLVDWSTPSEGLASNRYDGYDFVQYELSFIDLNKEKKIVWVSEHRSRAANGFVSGYEGIIEDITERYLLQNELAENEKILNETFEQAAVGMVHGSPDGRIVKVNNRFASILGYTPYEVIGMSYKDLTHPEDYLTDSENVADLLAGKRNSYSMEKRYIRKDGREVWVNLTVSLVRDSAGQPEFFVGVVEDIQLRKDIESDNNKLIFEMEERVKELQCVYEITQAIKEYDDLPELFISITRILCLGMQYIDASQARIIFDGAIYSAQEFEPSQWRLSSNIYVRDALRGSLEVYYTKSFAEESSGPFLWQEQNLIDTVSTLISEAVQRSEYVEEIRHLATHDVLTNLPNRNHLEISLLDEINRSSRYANPLCIMMLDIDYFKSVNDSYGHVIGDKVLVEFAGMLLRNVRTTDIAARYGGEEFLVILPETNLYVACAMAERLRKEVQASAVDVDLEDSISITTSIGVAEFKDPMNSANELIKAADKALYKAKTLGRNCVCSAG